MSDTGIARGESDGAKTPEAPENQPLSSRNLECHRYGNVNSVSAAAYMGGRGRAAVAPPSMRM